MTDNVRPTESEEDLLQAALSTAFNPPSLLPTPQNQDVPNITLPGGSAEPKQDIVVSALEPDASESIDSDSWKAEYEDHVKTWRAQSAEARAKAEKERERWEAIRAAEKEEAARRKLESPQDHGETGWETVGKKPQQESEKLAPERSVISTPQSLSPVDSRDLDTGEPQGKTASASVDREQHSRHPTGGDDSQKWEDIPSSLTSSFPSMSFPEHTEASSQEIRPNPPPQAPAPAPVPLSATMSIFDSSLPTRTRISAFVSSLAINMLLPFVNGVMLGFGEIFAKNVVLAWFGWTTTPPTKPGAVAATVGLGTQSPKRR